jgi:hypothetical protein
MSPLQDSITAPSIKIVVNFILFFNEYQYNLISFLLLNFFRRHTTKKKSPYINNKWENVGIFIHMDKLTSLKKVWMNAYENFNTVLLKKLKILVDYKKWSYISLFYVS